MHDLLFLWYWAIGTGGAFLIASCLNGALPEDSKVGTSVSLSLLVLFIVATGLGCAWVIYELWTDPQPPRGWRSSPALHAIFLSLLVSFGTVGVWHRFWALWKKKAKGPAHDPDEGS